MSFTPRQTKFLATPLQTLDRSACGIRALEYKYKMHTYTDLSPLRLSYIQQLAAQKQREYLLAWSCGHFFRACVELRRLHRQEVVNGRIFVAMVRFKHRLYHLDLNVGKHVLDDGDIFVFDRLGHGGWLLLMLLRRRLTSIGWTVETAIIRRLCIRILSTDDCDIVKIIYNGALQFAQRVLEI